MYPNLPVALSVDAMVRNMKESYKDNLRVIKDENMMRLMVIGIRKRIIDKLMMEVFNAVAGGVKGEGRVRSVAEAETIKWWKEVHLKAEMKSIPEDFVNLIISQVRPKEKGDHDVRRDDKKNG